MNNSEKIVEKMTMGVVGLGLIGGSLAKAYKKSGQWEVLGYDANHSIQKLAEMAQDLDGVLDENSIGQCELIFISVYPQAAVEYLEKMAQYISKDAMVIDCCGNKKEICEAGFALAEKYGFTFVGGHPMAGKHQSGYKYSTEELFGDAYMVIVPPEFNDIDLLQRVKDLMEPLGLRAITVTTAEEHDEIIAYTSQLAHVVSNAYIKSPTAKVHKGFSAGSYRDLTRVAWLNENMWTELFMGNRENLLKEVNTIIDSLVEYKEALEQADSDRMRKLLADGRKRKEEVDKF